MNQVILIGVVERAVEVRYFGPGHVHATFTLMTSEHLPTAQDPKRIIETRHRISAWGDMALRLERDVRVGAKMRVVGRLAYERGWSQMGMEQVWASIGCLELETLQAPSDIASTTSLAPAAPEIDWANFAPQADEDPMA